MIRSRSPARPPAIPFTVFGNSGNDTFNIGGGNFANLAGNVSVTGGAGNGHRSIPRHLLDFASTRRRSTVPRILTGGRTLGYATVEHLGDHHRSGRL